MLLGAWQTGVCIWVFKAALLQGGWVASHTPQLIQAQNILPAMAPPPGQEESIGPAPHRKHLACLSPPETTHWALLQELLPGFRKNPKGEGNLQKKKKNRLSFLHPLAPFCSSDVNILYLEPWITPALHSQHGHIHRELSIHLGKFSPSRGDCTHSFIHSACVHGRPAIF